MGPISNNNDDNVIKEEAAVTSEADYQQLLHASYEKQRQQAQEVI